jgi:hypothetical protein
MRCGQSIYYDLKIFNILLHTTLHGESFRNNLDRFGWNFVFVLFFLSESLSVYFDGSFPQPKIWHFKMKLIFSFIFQLKIKSHHINVSGITHCSFTHWQSFPFCNNHETVTNNMINSCKVGCQCLTPSPVCEDVINHIVCRLPAMKSSRPRWIHIRRSGLPSNYPSARPDRRIRIRHWPKGVGECFNVIDTVWIEHKFVMDPFLTRNEHTGLQEALDDELHVNSSLLHSECSHVWRQPPAWMWHYLVQYIRPIFS